MQFRRWFSALVFFSSSLPLLAAAGTVAGKLTVNGKTTQLTHVYATTRPDFFDKTKTGTWLVATDRELADSALVDDFAFMRATMKDFTGIDWFIGPDGAVSSLNIHSPALKKLDQFSSVGAQTLELKANANGRVAGHLFLPKPGEFFENAYQYDLTFDTPITVIKPEDPLAALKGTRLPAGGGEPAKAYDAYRKALLAGSVAGLKNTLSKERVASLSDPEFPKMLPVIQAMEPKNVKVTAGSVDGDAATLLIQAHDEHDQSTGTVSLVREAGRWKVSSEEWKSKND